MSQSKFGALSCGLKSVHSHLEEEFSLKTNTVYSFGFGQTANPPWNLETDHDTSHGVCCFVLFKLTGIEESLRSRGFLKCGAQFGSSGTCLIWDWRCSALRLLVFLCILRFRIFEVRVLNASK